MPRVKLDTTCPNCKRETEEKIIPTIQFQPPNGPVRWVPLALACCPSCLPELGLQRVNILK